MRMDVGLGKPGKLASRNLRVALPAICDFVDAYFESGTPPKTPKQVLICCETGRDLAVGVALALSCQFLDDEGNYRPRAKDAAVNKDLIRKRLSRITSAWAEANPSRTTLQSVNSYLMG
ncbi:hypothetical protein EKO27_g5054 [Xylaria grammica]|uniref:Rit1 DUSP-like domain-containing protein n=1 Tax=Xylaria grammica TaxID=363999 RepID=A0A439D6L0_9PEZI|nr:hypothetical protein EKO27_g5054 [Xylaria grammica]